MVSPDLPNENLEGVDAAVYLARMDSLPELRSVCVAPILAGECCFELPRDIAEGPELAVVVAAEDDFCMLGQSDGSITAVRVTSPADFDGDSDVDQVDFGHLQVCYSGSGQNHGAGCDDADLDSDGDVDHNDFGIFQAYLGGAGQPPACGP